MPETATQPKAKKADTPAYYVYACVEDCDVGYMNYTPRREHHIPGRRPPDILHYWRFKRGRDARHPADILITPRPIAKHFTDQIEKNIKRKVLDTGETVTRKTFTKVKFVLLRPDQITEAIRARAIELDLRPFDYADYDPETEAPEPKDVAENRMRFL